MKRLLSIPTIFYIIYYNVRLSSAKPIDVSDGTCHKQKFRHDIKDFGTFSNFTMNHGIPVGKELIITGRMRMYDDFHGTFLSVAFDHTAENSDLVFQLYPNDIDSQLAITRNDGESPYGEMIMFRKSWESQFGRPFELRIMNAGEYYVVVLNGKVITGEKDRSFLQVGETDHMLVVVESFGLDIDSVCLKDQGEKYHEVMVKPLEVSMNSCKSPKRAYEISETFNLTLHEPIPWHQQLTVSMKVTARDSNKESLLWITFDGPNRTDVFTLKFKKGEVFIEPKHYVEGRIDYDREFKSQMKYQNGKTFEFDLIQDRTYYAILVPDKPADLYTKYVGEMDTAVMDYTSFSFHTYGIQITGICMKPFQNNGVDKDRLLKEQIQPYHGFYI